MVTGRTRCIVIIDENEKRFQKTCLPVTLNFANNCEPKNDESNLNDCYKLHLLSCFLDDYTAWTSIEKRNEALSRKQKQSAWQQPNERNKFF